MKPLLVLVVPPQVSSLDLQTYLVVVVVVLLLLLWSWSLLLSSLPMLMRLLFSLGDTTKRVLSLLLNQYSGVVVESAGARCAVVVDAVLINIVRR